MADPGTNLAPEPPSLSPRRTIAYAAIAIATVLPRLVALAHERAAITPGFTLGEKSDDIARTYIDSGTFGFIPGHPTAYTQPLYSWFLIPLYDAFGRSRQVVGSAQIIIATLTALIVFEIGRRWLSAWIGLIAALLTALHPYSIWHDIHINREILDGLVAAALFLVVMALSSRRSAWLAAALGVVLGVAILGNVRLTALPLVLAVFLLFSWGPSWRGVGTLAVTFAVCIALLFPWVVRNKVEVGCATLTTDSARSGRRTTRSLSATSARASGSTISRSPRASRRARRMPAVNTAATARSSLSGSASKRPSTAARS